jgi:murein DD-endopeptidase MepM/ murein hydrolase activator NlpD
LRLPSARFATYGVVILLGMATVAFGPRLPERQLDLNLVEEEVAEAPPPKSHVDTLARGESLSQLLLRGGMTADAANEAIRAASMLDHRRIPAGMPVTLHSAHPDSQPTEVVLQLTIDRLVRLSRTPDGWRGVDEQVPWETDTIVVAGAINSTLYDAMREAAGELLPQRPRVELAWSIADIFEYRVDMSRDIQRGDEFRALVERAVSPSGAVRIGKVLAASIVLSGKEIQAVRFAANGEKPSYYDQHGKSMRAAFLRAPLEFRRMSSGFGMRRHPILGDMRSHKGVDYAAAPGTPVRTVGDGVVVRAGWGNGYGNVIEVRHRNGFVTRYAHLRGFAKGVRTGARVAIGETIGFVGSTGLSTGPHLHFEVLVGGHHRDPRVALSAREGEPIASRDKAAFEGVRSTLLSTLAAPRGAVRIASR